MNAKTIQNKFGTAPVFFTAISTILGAVMFLRFGFAVGTVGFWGTIAIIVIGHLVTIPTAMALAEIATNKKVEGGGEYFIISRSFGLVIGSSIGIALYLSQAISVAFYIIAFTEAFSSSIEYFKTMYDVHPVLDYIFFQHSTQTIGLTALILLTTIVLTKGADLGVKALYTVVAILGLTIVAFFAGDTGETTASTGNMLLSRLNWDELFPVFAIIFPAFTGMTAGVGLSGDLKNPRRSIPLGTLAGTIVGMVVYVFIAMKLSGSAQAADLVDTSKLVMADIALGGSWIIPIGLAAATISSALGSIMVAPRTLQAIARDNILPSEAMNKNMAEGRGKNDEPFKATLITVIIAIVFILIANVDMVAEIISMFFMLTYGSLCLISFLQHFAADPSYRPTFKTHWIFPFIGTIMCFGLMFLMNTAYAILAVILMAIIYLVNSIYNKDKKNLAGIFQGVIFQLSRRLHIFLQKAEKDKNIGWRPSVVCISNKSFDRFSAFDMLKWISKRYGFGTYIHQIEGYLSKKTNIEAHEAQDRLIRLAEHSNSNVYIDTLISPSYTSAIAQVIQLPGISGKENNLMMFEYSSSDLSELDDIIDNFKLIKSVDYDVMILGSSPRNFGIHKEIHIWLTAQDFENANLMILLSYIILGHEDWKNGEIKIFALYPEKKLTEEKQKLETLIKEGRLPISAHNVQILARSPEVSFKSIVSEKSKDADLTVIGFRDESVKKFGRDLFQGYTGLGNVLFINACQAQTIE